MARFTDSTNRQDMTEGQLEDRLSEEAYTDDAIAIPGAYSSSDSSDLMDFERTSLLHENPTEGEAEFSRLRSSGHYPEHRSESLAHGHDHFGTPQSPAIGSDNFGRRPGIVETGKKVLSSITGGIVSWPSGSNGQPHPNLVYRPAPVRSSQQPPESSYQISPVSTIRERNTSFPSGPLPGTYLPEHVNSNNIKTYYEAKVNQLLGKITTLTRDKDGREIELEEQRQIVTQQSESFQKVYNQMIIDHKDKTTSLMHDLAARDQELEDLKVEKKKLERNLEACKDQIFSMQPVQGLADNQLQEKYTSMCKDIEYWVDKHFGEAESPVIDLIRIAEQTGRDNMMSAYLSQKQHRDHVLVNPQIGLLRLQQVIFWYLHRKLLGLGIIYPGLDSDKEDFLKHILRGMSHLSPAKDNDAVQGWRVDLQRVLSNLAPIQSAHEEAVSRAEEKIMECLQLVRESGATDVAEQTQCARFVSAAADLAGNLRQSLAKYDFNFESRTENAGGLKPLNLQDLKKYNVIDCATGFALSSSAAPLANEDGRVGALLFVVFPGLVRKLTKTSQAIVLAKATVVVQFDKPVPRGGRKILTPGRNAGTERSAVCTRDREEGDVYL